MLEIQNAHGSPKCAAFSNNIIFHILYFSCTTHQIKRHIRILSNQKCLTTGRINWDQRPSSCHPWFTSTPSICLWQLLTESGVQLETTPMRYQRLEFSCFSSLHNIPVQSSPDTGPQKIRREFAPFNRVKISTVLSHQNTFFSTVQPTAKPDRESFPCA